MSDILERPEFKLLRDYISEEAHKAKKMALHNRMLDRQRDESRLADAKELLVTLPPIIAQQSADIARIEAMTEREILLALLPEEAKKEPATLLDLRSVPPGTTCELLATRIWGACGQHFKVVCHRGDSVEIKVLDEQHELQMTWCDAVQPARVLEQPTVAEHVQAPGMFAMYHIDEQEFWRKPHGTGLTDLAVDVGHYTEDEARNMQGWYPEKLRAYRLDDLHTVDGILKIKPGSKPVTFPAVQS